MRHENAFPSLVSLHFDPQPICINLNRLTLSCPGLVKNLEDPTGLDWTAVDGSGSGINSRGSGCEGGCEGTQRYSQQQQQRRSARNTRQSVVYTAAAAVINDRGVCCSGHPLGTATHQSSCKTNLTLANPPPHLLPP